MPHGSKTTLRACNMGAELSKWILRGGSQDYRFQETLSVGGTSSVVTKPPTNGVLSFITREDKQICKGCFIAVEVMKYRY